MKMSRMPANFNNLFGSSMVCQALDISLTTLDRKIQLKEFPGPDFVYGKIRKWRRSTVEKWILDRMTVAV